MNNTLANTQNFLAQKSNSVQFNIGQEAVGKIPYINSTNSSSDSYQSNFSEFLTRSMSFVMAIAALAVLLYLIWGAFEWITSSGDKGKLENARNKITQSVIGIIVLSAITGIFMVIQQFLGIKVINFGGSLRTNNSKPNVSYVCIASGFCHAEGSIVDRSNCGEGCKKGPNVCCRVVAE